MATTTVGHTPGPHEAIGVEIHGPDGMIGEVGFGMRSDAEMLANARLYAAATDLLAALEALSLAKHHGYSASTAERLGLTAEFLAGGVPSLGRAIWARAEAAISKATTVPPAAGEGETSR